jgi:hypothetical protein
LSLSSTPVACVLVIDRHVSRQVGAVITMRLLTRLDYL